MSSPTKTIFIPDTLENWPWPRVINPLYAEAKYAFDKCDFPLIAALGYPKASKGHLRSACDLMNLFFVIDEYTDVEPQPAVREMIDVVIDALKNPHKPRPPGEVVLGEIARQYWESTVRISSPTSQRHFLESFTAYLESVVEQAADRDMNSNHSIASYLEHRHENIGARPLWAVLEFQLDLPGEEVYHPAIVKLSGCIVEMIILDNDVASYNKEQAVGDDKNNILTVVMRELNFDLDQAMDWVVQHHAELQKTFLNNFRQVPTWGVEVDCQVQEYLDGMAIWARANVCWNFEGGRYFGNKTPEEVKNRRITLLPKIVPPSQNAALRRGNVVISLIEELECRA